MWLLIHAEIRVLIHFDKKGPKPQHTVYSEGDIAFPTLEVVHQLSFFPVEEAELPVHEKYDHGTRILALI